MKSSITAFAFALMLLSSCKKDKENAPYPYNAINTFDITINGEQISAAIQDKNIILYWPGNLNIPDSIAPSISISAHAQITPEAGKKIALKNGSSYSVKAEDGSTSVYTLKLIINQPFIEISENNDWSTPMGLVADNEFHTVYLNGFFKNLVPDVNKTSIYLVAPDGKETKMKILSITAPSFFSFQIPGSMTKEVIDYKVKLVSGVRTATSIKPLIKITLPPMVFIEIPNSFTKKKGETFTVTGKYVRDVNKILIGDAVTFEEFDLELVSQTATSVTIKIPQSIKAGTYAYIAIGFKNQFGNQDYVTVPGPEPMLFVEN